VSVSNTSHSSAPRRRSNFIPSWEEPHPGRRVSCTLNVEHGPVDGPGCNDTQENGRTGGDTVGPLVTVQAPAAPVPSTESRDHDAPASMGTSVDSSLTVAPDSDSAISGSLSCVNEPADVSCETAQDVAGFDKDTMMIDAIDDQSSPSSLPPSPVIEIRDVSDYLGNGQSYHHLDTTVEFHDSAFGRTPPRGDLYGWDAEFRRRGTPASPSSESGSDSMSDLDGKHYTGASVLGRGSSQRFGLLHRVLSTSKVSSRTSVRRIRP